MTSEYTTLARVKLEGDITDANADTVLQAFVNATNAELIRRTGVFLGPSADAARVFDGNDAVRYYQRLWIPGGIRTLTRLEVASDSPGVTFADVVLTDALLRPQAWELRPGQPFSRIDLISSTFPTGFANVRATGAFGYAAVPDDLSTLGDMIVLRMWEFRGAGSGNAGVTPSKFIFPEDAAMLEEYRAQFMPWGAT